WAFQRVAGLIDKANTVSNVIQDDLPALLGFGLSVSLPAGTFIETSRPFIGLKNPQHSFIEACVAQPLRGSVEQSAAEAPTPVSGVQVDCLDLAQFEIRRLAVSRSEGDKANKRAVVLRNEYPIPPLGRIVEQRGPVRDAPCEGVI